MKKRKIEEHLPEKQSPLWKRWTLFILFSIAFNFFLEALSRQSLSEAMTHMLLKPSIFTYNVIILLFTFILASFFSRKRFVLIMTASMWLLLGIGNFIILRFRTTPLSAVDFQLIPSVFGIVKVYLSPWQIGGMVLAILGLLFFFVYLYKRGSKSPVNHYETIPLAIILAVLTFFYPVLMLEDEAASETIDNLADAYDDLGFVSCFSLSIFDRGIDKPSDYDEDLVKAYLPEKTNQQVDQKVNLVIVQLESFFDVTRMKDYDFSTDPIPNFRALQAQWPSGMVKVPVIGAGTVNTEFEVLTGMDLSYFGPGEYPYTTILKQKTLESLPYLLGKLGYKSHGIHNNEGNFYDRNEVYPHLGFDSFSSVEYMYPLDFTPNGWVKDQVLTKEILSALEYYQEPSFVYAISVQPHGKYYMPEAVLNQDLKVTGPVDERSLIEMAYFAGQLQETDAFVGELVQQLAAFEEPTVVLFFGDHLPGLSIEHEDLLDGDRYQTEYVIWSNQAYYGRGGTCEAYELGGKLLNGLGFPKGLLLGQRHSEKAMHVLQYDMLYGQGYAYDQGLYEVKSLQMGLRPIVVEAVEITAQGLEVKGQGFTQASLILVDGKEVETTFRSQELLLAPGVTSVEEDLVIQQMGMNHEALSETPAWLPEK